jgi:hypothetical protein
MTGVSIQLPSKREKLEHFCGLYALKRKYIWKSSTPPRLSRLMIPLSYFRLTIGQSVLLLDL